MPRSLDPFGDGSLIRSFTCNNTLSDEQGDFSIIAGNLNSYSFVTQSDGEVTLRYDAGNTLIAQLCNAGDITNGFTISNILYYKDNGDIDFASSGDNDYVSQSGSYDGTTLDFTYYSGSGNYNVNITSGYTEPFIYALSFDPTTNQLLIYLNGVEIYNGIESSFTYASEAWWYQYGTPARTDIREYLLFDRPTTPSELITITTADWLPEGTVAVNVIDLIITPDEMTPTFVPADVIDVTIEPLPIRRDITVNVGVLDLVLQINQPSAIIDITVVIPSLLELYIVLYKQPTIIYVSSILVEIVNPYEDPRPIQQNSPLLISHVETLKHSVFQAQAMALNIFVVDAKITDSIVKTDSLFVYADIQTPHIISGVVMVEPISLSILVNDVRDTIKADLIELNIEILLWDFVGERASAVTPTGEVIVKVNAIPMVLFVNYITHDNGVIVNARPSQLILEVLKPTLAEVIFAPSLFLKLQMNNNIVAQKTKYRRRVYSLAGVVFDDPLDWAPDNIIEPFLAQKSLATDGSTVMWVGKKRDFSSEGESFTMLNTFLSEANVNALMSKVDLEKHILAFTDGSYLRVRFDFTKVPVKIDEVVCGYYKINIKVMF